MVRRSNKEQIYTREGLEAFNLLEHPVWVFDIEKKAMWWANNSALEVWKADSLESLLARNFADDMSDSTEQQLNEYLVRFRRSESINDQWTFYPNGKEAQTVYLTMSGILIEDGRLAMLAEGVLPICKEEIDKESLRGVEMLRRLPVPVCQFDLNGTLMYQNPASLKLFGPADESEHGPEEEEAPCHFLQRFGDKALGCHALRSISTDCTDYNVETQQITNKGLRSFSISLRKSKDPVTSEPVILYSARDITEIEQAKLEANQANSEKTERSEFFAVISHEIRSPLHQVIGFIDLLSQSKLAKQQAEYVSLMQNASMSLMSVINDLLDYTKIEAGKLKLESIPFEVKGVLEGCQQILEPKIREKGLSLKCSMPIGLPIKLMGDPNRLRQVLLNLLQNSVKFTNQGGLILAITNVIREENGKVIRIRFEVEDSGIGISEDQQGLIFCKYTQANPTIAASYGGTGLGLAICKSLVEAMGGTIGLESRLGHGTKVSFEIPFGAVSKELDAIETKLESVEETKNLRVLVVEDSKMNQKVVQAMLQRMGHTVVLADNGAIGVERVEKESFDVVLMDVQMPVMDGIEATKVIRSNGWSEKSLPIIGLTASFQIADLQYYKDIGMNDCIGKPMRIQTLKKLLNELNCKATKNANDICPMIEKLANPHMLPGTQITVRSATLSSS